MYSAPLKELVAAKMGKNCELFETGDRLRHLVESQNRETRTEREMTLQPFVKGMLSLIETPSASHPFIL